MRTFSTLFALLSSAIFNQGTGKLGNTILAKYPGGQIVARSAPAKTTSNPSAGQLAQQALFKTIQSFALAFKHYLPLVFLKLKPNQSSIASFMSTALKAARDNSKTALDDILKFTNVTRGNALHEIVSYSGLPSISSNVITFDAALTSVCQAGDPALDDKLYYYVVCPSLGLSSFISSGNNREDVGALDSNINVYKATDNYVGYCFVDQVNNTVSTSKVVWKANGLTNTIAAL